MEIFKKIEVISITSGCDKLETFENASLILNGDFLLIQKENNEDNSVIFIVLPLNRIKKYKTYNNK